jgi:hypothetical protein
VALIKTGNFDGALALNAQIANEMPFAGLVEGWFLGKIEGEWGIANTARDAWSRAKATAPDWQREVRAIWDANCAAFRGRERLAALAERLRAAKPKLEEARTKVAGLDAQLEAAKPKPAPKPEPAKPEAKGKYSADVFRPAPLPPEGATALEALTYPRGLVGHVME